MAVKDLRASYPGGHLARPKDLRTHEKHDTPSDLSGSKTSGSEDRRIPMSVDHEKFMALAVEESRAGLRAGDRPFGSVVVRDGEVVGRAYANPRSTGDPTAHAEVMAIRDAAANLKSLSLKGCTLYTSCDPCPMCCGAMLFSGIDTLVVGARSAALARISNRTPRTYTAEGLSEQMNMTLEVIRGILETEAEKVLEEFDWSKE